MSTGAGRHKAKLKDPGALAEDVSYYTIVRVKRIISYVKVK